MVMMTPVLATALFLVQIDFPKIEQNREDYLREAAAELCDRAMDEMFGIAAPDKTLLVVPLAGDQNNIVTSELVSQIRGRGKFKVASSSSKLDQLLEWAGLKGQKEDITTSAEAIKAAQGARAQYVLFGRVAIDSRGSQRHKVGLTMHLRVVNATTGDGVFIGSFTNRTEFGLLSATRWKVWVKDQSLVARIVVWTIVMLVLPFVILMFQELLAESKPLVPVLMIVVFTGFDVLFAFVLMGFEISSVWAAGVFVVALASSLFWNLFVMSRVSAMAKSA